MSKIKAIGIVLAIIVGVIALAFVLELVGLQWKKFFAPRHSNVEREVFKQTRSFNEGKLQELTKYRLEYLREKDPVTKKALGSTIRHQFADFDAAKLPDCLRYFLDDIRYASE